ncbi:type II toxin-antitoxin system Phd/YefM family antitoxin [Corticibacterium sp. UT-5YL-CI-8]|nr:type II toxin-antitoxin system Phd/YefM family antitoxin [Tianweitania sp. UT-5YL-CI-8]
MKRLQVRDAKAGFSSVIQAAENGEPTLITRHGRPAAVVVPVGDAERIYPSSSPNLGAFLATFPGGIEFERNDEPMRRVEW